MSTSHREPRATDVSIGDDEFTVHLVDGRKLTVPIAWSTRLSSATAAQRRRWQLIGDGQGIHWPEIDEDLSVAGLLLGSAANPTHGRG